MAAIYYEKIDVEGHHFGPDSKQVRTAVQQLDLAMQTLIGNINVSNINTLVIAITDTAVVVFIWFCTHLYSCRRRTW